MQVSTFKLVTLILKPTIIKQKITIIPAIIIASPLLDSFCCFYVSNAGTTLKNKMNQIILVRDGDWHAVSIYNAFKGNSKDFSMVIPVPVVLKKDDVKVNDLSVFHRLND